MQRQWVDAWGAGFAEFSVGEVLTGASQPGAGWGSHAFDPKTRARPLRDYDGSTVSVMTSVVL